MFLNCAGCGYAGQHFAAAGPWQQHCSWPPERWGTWQTESVHKMCMAMPIQFWQALIHAAQVAAVAAAEKEDLEKAYNNFVFWFLYDCIAWCIYLYVYLYVLFYNIILIRRSLWRTSRSKKCWRFWSQQHSKQMQTKNTANEHMLWLFYVVRKSARCSWRKLSRSSLMERWSCHCVFWFNEMCHAVSQI